MAEIVFARLVVVTNDRGKKRRREGTRKMDERTNNGVRNFKKFHKVTLHNYDSSCSLCMYIYKHSVSHTTSVLLYVKFSLLSTSIIFHVLYYIYSHFFSFKIQHIGLGTIPRLVSLKEYVPPTSRELQDWIGEYEVETVSL